MDFQALIGEENELIDLETPVSYSKRPGKIEKSKRKLNYDSIIIPKKVNKSGTMKESKGTSKVKFSSEMDLELLREVCVSRPFAGKYKEIPGKWESVRANLGWDNITALTIRRRFGLLHQKFRANESTSRQSSGQDEDHDEVTQLLTDIQEFMDSSKLIMEKENNDKEKQAEAIRDAALQGMRVSPKTELEKDEDLRSRNANKEANKELAKVFKEKNQSEFVIKEKELDFKKDKFEKLMEQQEKDRAEREADRKLELRRIEALELASQNQHQMMMKLTEKLSK